MCGLVLAMGKTSLTQSEIGIFKNMLAFDQLRGDHSTGLFSLFRPYNKAPFFKVNKDCLEGVDFVRSPLFINTVGHVSQLAGGVKSTEWAKAMFGHNRYATMGAVNAVNAHPFTHGHITLAHNGTLRNQSLLPDSEKFEVDSENVCYSIDKIGVAETVKRLNGAFALIWFNAADMTINVLRNHEREFHLFETSAGDWFGCSEEKMGDWLLTRGKTGKTIKRHFECTPGVQYVFDVSTGCVLKEEVKHELPTFRNVYSYQGRAASSTEEELWDQWYEDRKRRYGRGTSNSSGPLKPQEAEKALPGFAGLAQKFAIDVVLGQSIEFEQYSYQPYTNIEGKETGFGMVVGWLDTADEYIEVQVHQVKKAEFTMNGRGYAEVVSGFEKNTCLHILAKVVTDDINTAPTIIEHEKIVEPRKETDEEDTSFLDEIHDGFGDDSDVLTTASGDRFTLKDWRGSRHNTCCECGDPILFDDVPDAVIVNGYCFCGGCADSKKAKAGPKPGTTSNNITYTRKEWEKCSVCINCGKKFGYNEAHETETIASYTFCKDDQACDEREEKLAKAAANHYLGDKAEPAEEGKFCTACGVTHYSDVLKGTMDFTRFQSLSHLCYHRAIYKDKFSAQLMEVADTAKQEKSYDFCEACTQVHSVYIRTGNMSAETWQKLKEGCKTKEKYRAKFQKMIVDRDNLALNKPVGVAVKVSEVRQIPTMTVDAPKREVLSLPAPTKRIGISGQTLPCTCCGHEFFADKIKGGVCVTCRARFQSDETGTKINNVIPLIKKGGTSLTTAPDVILSSKDLKWFENNRCPDCGWIHTDKLIRGTMSLGNLKAAAVKDCRLVKYWMEKKHGQEALEAEMNVTTDKQLQSQPPMIVCEDMWEKMCECRKCGDKIPFEEANQVQFWGSAPLCLNCQHDSDLAKKGGA